MNLLENDVTDIICDNYSVSLGYVNRDIDISTKAINDGIIATKPISKNDIKRCSNITPWKQSVVYSPNTFYRVDDKIYVCLYSPGSMSLISPVGFSHFNVILDDNYVWRYICSTAEIIDDYLVVPSIPTTEIIRKGCVSSIDITHNSGHQITSFSNFYINANYVSGSGLQYVVENDQNTMSISDVLVQTGGLEYQHTDILVVTDIDMDPLDIASVEIYIEDGKVKLQSFTNGQNYSHIDIIIIGDGSGASAQFSTVAGVLTNVTITGGANYTWAKAVIINSEKYIIGSVNIEPLNGYDADLVKHIGPNKYIITSIFNDIIEEINYYGIHKKTPATKYVFFDNVYFIDSFIPIQDEIIKLKLILG